MDITTSIISSSFPPLNIQSLSPSSPPLISSSSKFGPPNFFFSNEALTNIRPAKDSGDLIARRRKRRKRRKELDYLKMEENRQCEGALLETVNGGYLSPIEEARFCLFLQNEARLEVARRRIAELQEHEPTSKQLANATRMGKRNVDKILCKGRVSRERITQNYRGLVISIANSYRGKGLSIQDLIQEGSVGLLRGAERFDPRKGNKLSTYVYWWIKEAIVTSISNKSRLVRLPRSMQEKIIRIAEAKIELRKRLGRLPSYDEIAEVVNIHVSTVGLGFEMSRSPLSLDRAISDQGGLTIQEIIPGPEEMLPEKMLKKRLMKQELEKLIKTLSEREERILRLIFGFNGQTPQSCEEIGRVFNLSRERIRQINNTALLKLRYRGILDDLKVYVV